MLSRGQAILPFLIILPGPLEAQITSLDPTATQSKPELFDGNSEWALLGCYNEVNINSSSHALGTDGTYFSPPSITPENLNVSLCLDGCGDSLAPDGVEPWKYAGVESSWGCFCGQTISKDSTLHSSSDCSSPCTSDREISCGGAGYLLIYQLRSTLTPANTSSSNTTSTESPISTAFAQNAKNNTRMWVGIAIGIFVFLVILALISTGWILRRRKLKRARDNPDLDIAGILAGEDGVASFTTRRNPSTVVTGGRRNRVVDDSRNYVNPLSAIPEDGDRQRIEALEGWKKGVVPPLSADDMVVASEAEGSQYRRGTVAEGYEELNTEDHGLRTEGLAYVDSRLEELETSVPEGCEGADEVGTSQDQQVGNEREVSKNGNRSDSSTRQHQSASVARNNLSVPDQVVVGREGASKTAWWEKPGLHRSQKRK